MRALFAAAALAFASPAAAQPAFEPCRACHALTPGAPAEAGPNLAGLIGRRVGGDPNFDYSPALQAAAATGQRWDEALLDRFLQDPDAMFPGLWMAARGVSDPAERRAIIDAIVGSGRQ